MSSQRLSKLPILFVDWHKVNCIDVGMFVDDLNGTATGLNSTRKKRLLQLFSHVCTITKTLIGVTAKFFSAPRSTFR